jgi:hypothetical protein
MFKKTNFRLYFIMGLGGLFRGIGFALSAAASSVQDATTGEGIVYGFFTAAGLGIAIALNCLMAVVYLKNSRESVRALEILMKLQFPLVIILGPILGLAMAALIYGNSFPLPQNVLMVRRGGKSSPLSIINKTDVSSYLLSHNRHQKDQRSWLVDRGQHRHRQLSLAVDLYSQQGRHRIQGP